jgi:ATP-dependent Lon protease
MFALLRAAPAIRRGLYARPRLFSSSLPLFVKSGNAVKAPRWVNSRQPQDTPPAQEEDDSNEPDEPTENSDPLSSNSESPSSSTGDATSSASPPSNPPPPSTPGSIAKQSVPEIYPQVLALPIARRPLFPGFYKAVVIRNPGVVAAIKEMMKRGQPYLGAFLLKDENTDSDVITDISSVHEVGVFAQITSVFAAVGRGDDDREEGLTAVLYPHRRIKITELVKPGPAKPPPQVEPQSVEPPTPSPSPPPDRQVAEKSGTFRLLIVSSLHSNYTQGPVQTAFLHKHNISIVNVDLITLPYNKDDQYIRAFMFEIISVFKDIAQLNPLFRDQITTFLSTKLPPTFSMYQTNLPILQLLYPPVQELQDVLESLIVDDRLRKALLILKKRTHQRSTPK